MGTLTPIAELPDVLGEDFNIAWQLSTGAYIDGEQIGLDIARTQRLITVAGLSAVAVRGFQGEQSQIETTGMSVSGINTDGSATGAGTAKATKVPMQNTSLQHRNEEFQYRWPIANIGVNRAELASRVSDGVLKGGTREVAWAGHVDRALRAGIANAALQGLLKDPLMSAANRINVLSFATFEAMFAAMHAPLAMSAIWALRSARPFLIQAAAKRLRPERAAQTPFKSSLLPDGVQLDRLGLTYLMADMGRLVRPIESSSR